MPSTSKHVQIQTDGPVRVARIVGEPVLYEQGTIQEIGAALYDAGLGGDISTLVVNLRGVNYASTEVLAKLLSLNKRMEAARKRLILCGLGPMISDALRGMRISSLFDIRDTEEEVLGLSRGAADPAPVNKAEAPQAPTGEGTGPGASAEV
jgi:anti-sigma B factor antagonist